MMVDGMGASMYADNLVGAVPADDVAELNKAISKQVAEYQAMEFSTHKKAIARLSMEKKLAWYATQNPQVLITLGNNPAFQRFWRWHVLIPMKARRFYYRLKNGELWKRYRHITDTPELRTKRKPGPALI